jgi:putative spermidine/putrescine transport system permease protein
VSGSMVATGAEVVERQHGRPALFPAYRGSLVWLVAPAAIFFLIFFIIPVGLLLAVGFNPMELGVVTFQPEFSLEPLHKFFSRPLYYDALIRSVELAVASAFFALILGYPLAYLVAKERRPGRANLYMILILTSMQLGLIIRMYGLMVLMGDAGLINDALLRLGVISQPLPLMYNLFGVMVGLVQLSLPFMVLSLIGIIQGIDPAVEEAARSLGASRWRTFFTITFPLSMPGVLAGSLLVFAIAVGSYAVPVLMGGSKVFVMPLHIYQQIAEVANWQFAAAIAGILFSISLFVVFVYHRYTQKYIGGLV